MCYQDSSTSQAAPFPIINWVVCFWVVILWCAVTIGWPCAVQETQGELGIRKQKRGKGKKKSRNWISFIHSLIFEEKGGGAHRFISQLGEIVLLFICTFFPLWQETWWTDTHSQRYQVPKHWLTSPQWNPRMQPFPTFVWKRTDWSRRMWALSCRASQTEMLSVALRY